MKAARKLNFNDTFRIAKILNLTGVKLQDIETIDTKGKNMAKKAGFEAARKRLCLAEDAPDREGKIKEIEETLTMELDTISGQTASEMIDYIFTHVTTDKAEKDIYKFLAVIADVKPEEIEKASITDIAELVLSIYEENKEELKNFFSRAARSATVLPST